MSNSHVRVTAAASVIVLALGTAVPAGSTTAVTQRDGAPPVGSVRLYVLDCGQLVRGDSNPGRYGLTLDQVETPDFADPCYLIAHPEGTLLWEAGIIPDRLIEPGGTELPSGPANGGQSNRADRTLRVQLREIGYDPTDITYLAFSHRHGDHVANVNDYAGSTWLVQEAGRDAMFTREARERPSFDTYRALENARTIVLDGDHDVFGDGAVVLKATPGHTEGHQSLFVRLEQTGPLLLSGDLYHFPAERTLDTFPDFEADREQTARSREAIERFLETSGARLWIQHDLVLYRTLRRAPAYYE